MKTFKLNDYIMGNDSQAIIDEIKMLLLPHAEQFSN